MRKVGYTPRQPVVIVHGIKMTQILLDPLNNYNPLRHGFR